MTLIRNSLPVILAIAVLMTTPSVASVGFMSIDLRHESVIDYWMVEPAQIVTPNDVQRLYTKLKKSGRIQCHPEHGHTLSDSVIRSIHTTFHNAMKTAQQVGVIAKIQQWEMK